MLTPPRTALQALPKPTGWLNTVQSTALLSATLREKRIKQDMCMSRGISAISARKKPKLSQRAVFALKNILVSPLITNMPKIKTVQA